MHQTIKSNIRFHHTGHAAPAEFTMYWCRDPLTDEYSICIVANTEQEYFELEKEAQRRGKTVEQHVCAQMIGDLTAHCFNIPPDVFPLPSECRASRRRVPASLFTTDQGKP